MSANLNAEFHRENDGADYPNAGRRGTDRVVKIWQEAEDKRSIPGSLDRDLWDNCFLIAMDEIIDYCVLIDHGQKAGVGLNLPPQKSKNLRSLPPRLRDLIFSLGQKCIKEGSPCSFSQGLNESKEIPASQYRLALVPLMPAGARDDWLRYPTTSVLGVFTYH